MAGHHLLGFLGMADATVFGGHESRDGRAFVLVSIEVTLVCLVAVQASDVVLGVIALVPLVVKTEGLFLVTRHALTGDVVVDGQGNAGQQQA